MKLASNSPGLNALHTHARTLEQFLVDVHVNIGLDRGLGVGISKLGSFRFGPPFGLKALGRGIEMLVKQCLKMGHP